MNDLSVGLSVCLSSALWKNGGSDPDAIRHHRSDGSRDEVDSVVWESIHGKGYFWGELGARHCNQWGLTFAAQPSSQSQISLGKLVIIIIEGGCVLVLSLVL